MSDELQDGSACLDMNCTGLYDYTPDGECVCHISPPCGSCENSYLVCGVCSLTPDEMLSELAEERNLTNPAKEG